jgi:prolyl-tRNA synthetase
VIVEAEPGPIGGSASHEFMIPCDNGEDIIVHTEDGAYAANIEKAEVDPLPKAAAVDAPAPEDVHTPDVGTIDAVCEFLGTRPEQMIKTLVYSAGEKTVVALARGDHEINDAKLMHAAEADHVELADDATVQRVTEAVTGFAGPVGLAEKVDQLIIDHGVAAMAVGVTGANKTDYHTTNVVPDRDFPLDGDNVTIADIRNAAEGDTHQGQPLQFSRGIEVGHVFKLGTKYSEKLGATFLDENGATQPAIMGCYGIGINRILAGAIELAFDKDGPVLPVAVAPFEIEVIQLNSDSETVTATAGDIYDKLQAAGVDVLLDDRDARPGVKFKDADLIGIPLRIVVGEKGLKDGNIELKRRTDAKPALVPADSAVAEAMSILDELKAACSG